MSLKRRPCSVSPCIEVLRWIRIPGTSPLSMSSDQPRFFPAHMHILVFAVVSICKNAHIRS